MTDKQKKMLGLGGVGLAGLLIYRHMHSATATSVTPISNSSASGSIAPFDPQPVTTLQPGESVYDPNSQALLTTPSPIDTTGGAPGDTGTQASAPAQPQYAVNVNYPPIITTTSNRTKPVKRVANPIRPKNVPANAVYTGNKAPGANYKGVGAGWWVKK